MTHGILQTHAALRAGYKPREAKLIKYRKYQLLQLAYLLQDGRERFNNAVKNGLGRSPLENGMCAKPRRVFDKQLTPMYRLPRSKGVSIMSRNGPGQSPLSFPCTL